MAAKKVQKAAPPRRRSTPPRVRAGGAIPSTVTSPAGDRVLVRFRWNEAAQQYIDPAGRFVSRTRVRLAVDRAIQAEQAEIRRAVMALRSKTITVDEWYARMRSAVKNVELYSAAAARGGWAQMTQADYGRVGAAVKKQYAYLDRFAGHIEAGAVDVGSRGFLVRAESYANAGRALYQRIQGAGMERAGFRFERNVLRPADHCADCVGETGAGWVPIGELIPIGERQCLGNCQCLIEYK